MNSTNIHKLLLISIKNTILHNLKVIHAAKQVSITSAFNGIEDISIAFVVLQELLSNREVTVENFEFTDKFNNIYYISMYRYNTLLPGNNLLAQ